jgi:hypothetical protein
MSLCIAVCVWRRRNMAWLVDEVAYEDMQDTINTRETEGYVLRFTFPRFGLIEQASSAVVLVFESNGDGGAMNPLGIPGLIYTQFTLEYAFDAGVEKHAILQMNAHIAERLASSFATTISDPDSNLVTTPQGNDATTAFANGLKISSAATHVMIFDTGEQDFGEVSVTVDIARAIGLPSNLFVSPVIDTKNINGVTRRRLELHCFAGDNPLNLTTFSTDDDLLLNVVGWLKPLP